MDNFGGVNPNPGQAPRLDSVPQQPMQPQQPTFVDPTMVQPQSFASVPMTDPNAPGPMMPPMMQQTQPIDSMLDSQPVSTGGGSGKGKTIGLVIAGIVLLLGIGIGGYFVGFGMGKSAGKQQADAEYQAELAKQQEDEGSKEEKLEELDLTDQKDPTYSEDEALEGAVGEVLTAADGFVIKVTSIERNFKTDDPAFKADPAKELIKVNFQMGNATKTKTMDISNAPFKITDSSGAEIVPTSLSEYEGKFDVTKLDPGTQSTGSLIFTVVKDESPLVLTRTQKYRISNQNREVTFSSKITLTD